MYKGIKFLDECGGVIWDMRYWRCDCSENYIHLKEDNRTCNGCLAEDDERPDARLEEIPADEWVKVAELLA